MSSRARLHLAGLLFSSWMILLLTGWVGGGATHLLLAVALLLFPWRAVPLRRDEDDKQRDE